MSKQAWNVPTNTKTVPNLTQIMKEQKEDPSKILDKIQTQRSETQFESCHQSLSTEEEDSLDSQDLQDLQESQDLQDLQEQHEQEQILLEGLQGHIVTKHNPILNGLQNKKAMQRNCHPQVNLGQLENKTRISGNVYNQFYSKISKMYDTPYNASSAKQNAKIHKWCSKRRK